MRFKFIPGKLYKPLQTDPAYCFREVGENYVRDDVEFRMKNHPFVLYLESRCLDKDFWEHIFLNKNGRKMALRSASETTLLELGFLERIL